MTPRRTSRVGRVVGSAVLLVGVIAAAGCAQGMRQPMPNVSGRLALKVRSERPSKTSEMPIGVYQVPDTSVYVSGHQGAAPGVGAAFGLVGLAVAHLAAQHTGEKKTAGAGELLRIDIPAATQRALAEALERYADTVRFVTDRPGDSTIEIIPYLVLTFVSEEEVRPWVILKTALKDSRGDEKWKTRYIASAGEVRPLTGERGWVSEDGALLRTAVDRGLRTALDVLLRDASGQLRRGTGRTAKVKHQWVWIREPSELTVEVLDETDSTLIVTPKVADSIVYAGVNILDKRDFEESGRKAVAGSRAETRLRISTQGAFEAYRSDAKYTHFKAFAVDSYRDVWGRAWGSRSANEAIERALAQCRKQRGAGACELYAVGDTVVAGMSSHEISVEIKKYADQQSEPPTATRPVTSPPATPSP